MADRSCAVYFLNHTPFQLRRRSFELETGHWEVEPPETIDAKPKSARQPNVFAWKSAAPWANPFRGTQGFVEYTIQDRIENVFLEVKDERGVIANRLGTSGCVRIDFGSPFTGAPWCNVSLKACGDVLGSDDPSPFYFVNTGLVGRGDSNFWKELAEVLPVGPMAILTSWLASPAHHPVFANRVQMLVGVDDKHDQVASHGVGLTVEDPRPRYLELRPIRGGGEAPWSGRWQSFLPDGRTDVDLEIRRQADGILVVDVTDNTRSVRQAFTSIPVTLAPIIDYAGNVRRTPSPVITPNRPLPPRLNQVSPPAQEESGVSTLNRLRIKPGRLSRAQVDASVAQRSGEMGSPEVVIRQIDTLQVNDHLALHLYGLADLEGGGTIRGHAVQYVETLSGEVVSNLMLRQSTVIR
ncbi:hypothetical protein AAII07_48810 [Microvirga sp. 0TCS3.31]